MADITYIVVGTGFAYLILLTDAYLRKIIGYTLEASLAAEGAIKALAMAILQRVSATPVSTIHHSDQGSQYCCWEYIKRLDKATIKPSMTRVIASNVKLAQ